ncbi:hypothetical protein [Nocardia sp. NPDC004604]|uniref:hypothetical protein n=1 Tax=Nocardia sp. NPDC004604 TaxID=3157013 RepID=UPI0033BA5425
MRLLRHSRSDLDTILYEAIASTAKRLQLHPGSAPSSTVAILRVNSTTIDSLVLGDSSVVIGGADDSYDAITDDRLSQLRLPESSLYRSRLDSGTGYDTEHHALLAELQRRERTCRNTHGGYWIAEANPDAANHAFVTRYARSAVPWAVLATDGASDPLVSLGVSWPEVARLNADELANLLTRCHRWESDTDPNGQQQPRPKRHDDKAIAVVRL